MTAPVIGEIRRRSRQAGSFNVVYLAMIFFGLHWALVLYVNSTYLERYVSSEAVGALFTIGAAVTILSFLFISRILRALGNYKLTVGLALIEFFTLISMGFVPRLEVVIPLFILHQAIAPLLLFNLDVFTERLIGTNEDDTGSTRGLVLTIMSLAGAVAPLVAGFVLGDASPRFAFVYVTSAVLMLPFLYLIFSHFKTFSDPRYTEVKVLDAIRNFWEHTDLRHVFLAHFVLQLFFSWMVIYVPLYLATVIGLPWDKIGIILFSGLMAYVLLEWPIGIVADNHYGEKEMMIGGFVIIIISTIWISFIDTTALIPWMAVMFATRVGASFVETTTESYFFKHTRSSDANIISFFRITRPLAYFVGALLGSLTLLYIPFSGMFVVLGILLLPGIFLSFKLHDTR